VIDARVQEERARWYLETVRSSSLPRLLVAAAQPSPSPSVGGGGGGSEAEGGETETVTEVEERKAAAEKLALLLPPYGSVADGGGGGGDDDDDDPVRLAREVAQLVQHALGCSPDRDKERDAAGRLGDVLLRGGDAEEIVQAWREACFTVTDASSSSGGVPENQKKYLEMLGQGLPMEQVVERIAEDRQAAAGARAQVRELSQRLDDLRRARAAYELQKRRRESQAQERVPDDVYNLPACAVCGEVPAPRGFFCCGVCAILHGKGIVPQQTVFCSPRCEEKGHVRDNPPITP
jgi:hypothetical protein